MTSAVSVSRITLLAGSILSYLTEQQVRQHASPNGAGEPGLLIRYRFLNRDSTQCPLSCLDSVSSDRYERLWKWLSLYGAPVVGARQ